MVSKLVLVVCLALAAARADETVHDEPAEEETGLSSIQLPDLTMSEGVLRAMSIAGALVTGVAGLAAILSFILPLIGFRTCAMLGTCDQEPAAFNPATNSVYDHQQGFSGYQYGGGFKKRSLEYVGPILKALSSAYDKYGPPAQRKAEPKGLVAK